MKHFINERNPLEVEIDVHLHCTEVSGFCALLWQTVKPYIKKEVRFANGQWEWIEDEFTVENVSRFVLFCDRRQKTCYKLAVNNKTLFNWSKGTDSHVSCYIFT